MLAKLRYARIFSQSAFNQRLTQPTLERFDHRLQLLPRNFVLLEGMPRGEEFFDNSKSSVAHKNTRAAQVDDLLEVAFQVRPTKLTAFLGYLQVNIPAITVQDAVDFFAQERRQAQSAAFGVDDKHRHVGRGRGPQPTQFAPQFPTGLVGKFDFGLPNRFERFLMSRRQGGADFLFEIGDRAQSDRGAKQIGGQLLDITFAQAEVAGQIRQRRRQTRAHAVFPNRRGDRRLVDGTAAGTGTGVGLIFSDIQDDGGQLDRLKALRLRIVGSRFGR